MRVCQQTQVRSHTSTHQTEAIEGVVVEYLLHPLNQQVVHARVALVKVGEASETTQLHILPEAL